MSRLNKAVPYVLKDNYIQITIKGQPFALDSSHPTFDRLKKAIREKNWKYIPKLVNLAKSIMFESEGDVTILKGVVYYKGKPVQSSLTQRIIELVRRGKPVKHLVRFMDNLYKNPSEQAIRQFYDWLIDNDLPITDNGCFIAYKSVRSNYTDTYTGKVSNKPGQTIMMSRAVTDHDYNTQCSTGFHICSKNYGIYGDKVMAVMVNPRYVLSAVGGKMRVTKYEVLMELADKNLNINKSKFQKMGISTIEGKLVIEVRKERQELMKMLLESSVVKRLIRRKKITKTTIKKSSYGRLKLMAQKYSLVPRVGPEDNRFLKAARVAAGLSIGQVAKQSGVSYKTIATLEQKENPPQDRVDQILEAIAKLTHSYNKAVTYPQPVTA